MRRVTRLTSFPSSNVNTAILSSITLEMARNIGIGLKLSGAFLASALYTGEPLAFFQLSGNVPVSKLWLIISCIVSEIYRVASLRSFLEILSSPQIWMYLISI